MEEVTPPPTPAAIGRASGSPPPTLRPPIEPVTYNGIRLVLDPDDGEPVIPPDMQYEIHQLTKARQRIRHYTNFLHPERMQGAAVTKRRKHTYSKIRELRCQAKQTYIEHWAMVCKHVRRSLVPIEGVDMKEKAKGVVLENWPMEEAMESSCDEESEEGGVDWADDEAEAHGEAVADEDMDADGETDDEFEM